MSVDAVFSTKTLASSVASLEKTSRLSQASGEDFSSTLADMMRETSNAIQSSEKTSMAGLRGEASVQEVSEAVMQAERSLQTAIALRDKGVSAYLELTRMAI